MSVTGLLGLSCCQVLRLLLLDGADHLTLFTLELFALFHALHLSLFDLLDDNGSTTSLGLCSKPLTLILSLQGLQTLNLHHQIKTFLLIEPLSF